MKCDRCGRQLAVTELVCAVCGNSPHTAAHTPFAGSSDATIGPDADSTRLGTAPPSERASDTGPLSVGQSFGGRYHIVRLLGIGGMGAVYQAWDQELGVIAALKVTRPEIANDPAAAQVIERRFKQELLLARKVTHKNVVRIHDLGEVDGIKYITMPFIEGEDLASVLEREGTLPLARVLRIARSMISGLVAAHSVGVVHRDLKPANIMLDADGEALITDFGIARSTGGPASSAPDFGTHGGTSAAAPQHTVAGAVVGTIGYMAPEQAQAKPVDERADVYAVGLILYDMLGGRARFTRAESPIAELTSRMLAPPPSLRTFNPAVPEAVDRLVTRCLQPDPAARYQTSAGLAADLDQIDDSGKVRRKQRHLTRRLAATIVSAFAVLLALTWWLARTGPTPAPPAPLSLLIADFDNKTGEAVFSGAIEQALGIAMEGAAFISAYPRAKAHQIAAQLRPGAPLDEPMARLVATREALNAILAGSIERDGAGYSVAARALDASQPADAPRVLASASASARTRDDVLPAIARLSSDLRRRLGDRTVTRGASAPSDTFTAASLDAMRAYVRGQDLQVAGRFDDALKAYQEAVTVDPGFGRAYAGMAVIYGNLKQPAKAEENFQKALKNIDRMTEREKYSTMGGYYLLVSHDYQLAIKNYEALVSGYPADRGGHANLAYAYLNRRQMDRAVAEVRAALALEPANLLQQMNYAMYSLYASDFATAIDQSGKIPRDSGLYPYALLTVGRAAAARGDLAQAADAYTQLSAAGPAGAAMAVRARADLAMYQGQYGRALDLLKPLATQADAAASPDETAMTWIMIAEAHAAAGRRKEAGTAAAKASTLSRRDDVLLAAGIVFLDLGETARAEQIAADLDNRLQPQSRAYARMIAGLAALRSRRLPAALDALRESTQRLDTWLVHLLLGRTYLEAGQGPEALAEFETCLKRQGEATDLFFTDNATLRYLAPADYYLARAEEALGSPRARMHYDSYATLRANTDVADPLLKDARERAKK